uniref:Uncharacterized protein n=1 Tax=Solanum lycopersicum TaxID=4081 RepID=A0A3Q7IG69_SOLLC
MIGGMRAGYYPPPVMPPPTYAAPPPRKNTGAGNVNVSSSNSLFSHTSSPATFLRALYSASAEDRDIVFCFLDFQLSGLFPINTI